MSSCFYFTAIFTLFSATVHFVSGALQISIVILIGPVKSQLFVLRPPVYMIQFCRSGVGISSWDYNKRVIGELEHQVSSSNCGDICYIDYTRRWLYGTSVRNPVLNSVLRHCRVCRQSDEAVLLLAIALLLASLTAQYHLVPPKEQRHPAVGKVTVVYASHSPYATVYVVYPLMSSKA